MALPRPVCILLLYLDSAPVLCALLSTLCWAAPMEDDLTFAWEIDPFSRPSRSSDMGAHLDDVQTVFVVLSRIDTNHVALIKEATEELRPICTRLRALPPDELQQLCLLADAIEWQTDRNAMPPCSRFLRNCPSFLPWIIVFYMQLLSVM